MRKYDTIKQKQNKIRLIQTQVENWGNRWGYRVEDKIIAIESQK